MKKKTLLGLALVGALCIGASKADAQESVGATAQLTIGTILFISIDQSSITFPSPGATEFDVGHVDANETSTLAFGGNVPYDVEIEADAGNFTPSGASSFQKPATDLLYSLNSGASYTPITASPVDIVTGNPAGSGSQTVDYRVLLDESLDVPGTYTLGFTYTVAPN